MTKTVLIVAWLVTMILCCYCLITIGQSSVNVSVIVWVFNDGTAKVVYNVSSNIIPLTVTLPLLGKAYYIEAFSNNTPIPVQYNGTHVTLTILSNNTSIAYYTSNLTWKKGYEWTLRVSSPWTITIVLPSDSLVYYVEPEDFDVTVIDNEIGFRFKPGVIEVKYLIVPLPPATSTNTSSQGGLGFSQLYFTIPLAVVVAGIGLFMYLRKARGREELRLVDERDKMIVKVLLEEGELTPQEIVEKTGIPKTPLYRRLKRLEKQGIIGKRVSGGRVYYYVKDRRTRV